MSRRRGLCCWGGGPESGTGTVLAPAEGPAPALGAVLAPAEVLVPASGAALVCAAALLSTLALAAPSASPARADTAVNPATSPNTPTTILAARRGRPTKPLMLRLYS